jgi:hypothetical protein
MDSVIRRSVVGPPARIEIAEQRPTCRTGLDQQAFHGRRGRRRAGKLSLKTEELVAAIKPTRAAWSTTFGAGSPNDMESDAMGWPEPICSRSA